MSGQQKQGVLPLWFSNKNDYSLIDSVDTIETFGLSALLEGNPSAEVTLKVTKRNGVTIDVATKHTMSEDQLKWLMAGSALNYIRSIM